MASSASLFKFRFKFLIFFNKQNFKAEENISNYEIDGIPTIYIID